MEKYATNPDYPVIIIGAGGHAKVICDTLLLGGKKILGFIDPTLKVGTEIYNKLCILGDDSYLTNSQSNHVLLANGIGKMPRSNLRADVFQAYKNRSFAFITVIHPSATISNHITIEEGAQIMASSTLQHGVVIGKNTIINTGSIVDHDCFIGAHSHLATGAILSGGVKIGDNVHIGTGAIIIQNIQIEESAIIGAGSVVVKNVSCGETVIGVPARKM